MQFYCSDKGDLFGGTRWEYPITSTFTSDGKLFCTFSEIAQSVFQISFLSLQF